MILHWSNSPEKDVLEEIENPDMTEKDIAFDYAGLIILSDAAFNATEINTAIRERFGKAGLLKIKRAAWKLLEDK